MRPLWYLAGLGASMLSPAPSTAATAIEKVAQRLSALTPESVAAKVSLKDDELEATAVFDTQSVYQEKEGLLRIVNNDVFLRAFVDKRTGRTRYQVYSVVTYSDSQWQFFDRATFLTSQGVSEVSLDVIHRQVVLCSAGYGCQYSEQVGFELNEEIVRAIARLYVPGGPLAIWRFRLKAKGGRDHDDGIAVAEVAGLVQRVDAWVAAQPAERASMPANATPTPPRGGLGIAFAATTDGALVAQVVPGSRAERVGIKVGALITAVDGRSLSGLSLEAMRQYLTALGAKTLSVAGMGDLALP